MKILIPNSRRVRRQALLMTTVAMIVVYVLWNVPAFDAVMYPLRLFVTYVHEAGHSLAALVSGGRVEGFVVSADGSGVATTAGGSRALILPAGYLGAAAFGSLLFYLVNRFPRYSRELSAATAFGMAVFTALFARPDDRSGLPIALLVGLGFGAVLMFIAWKFDHWLTMLVLNVLAVTTALNAVLDVWYLTQFIGTSRGSVRNDAVAFSEQVAPLLPPVVIAFVWAGLAAVMLALAAWYGVIKPLGREIDATI